MAAGESGVTGGESILKPEKTFIEGPELWMMVVYWDVDMAVARCEDGVKKNLCKDFFSHESSLFNTLSFLRTKSFVLFFSTL
jgi:hypothetical protein